MLVQGGMWIVGTFLIFFIFFITGKFIVAVFFPDSYGKKATKKLKDKIEKLERIKLSLETKKLEASLGEETLKVEIEIAKTNVDLGKLQTKLDKIQGGENGS